MFGSYLYNSIVLILYHVTYHAFKMECIYTLIMHAEATNPYLLTNLIISVACSFKLGEFIIEQN